jgi:AbrB family looped-hinge helix DNA binding protein
MRVSELGQITIPKRLREQFGLDHNVEVEITPTEDGLLIRKCDDSQHPVNRVFGILSRTGGPAIPIDNVDDYIEEIRGR